MNIKELAYAYINPEIVGVLCVGIAFSLAMVVVVDGVKGFNRNIMIALACVFGVTAFVTLENKVWSDEFYTHGSRSSVGQLVEINGELYTLVVAGDGDNVQLNKITVLPEYKGKYREVYKVIDLTALDTFILYDSIKAEAKKAESPDCSTPPPIKTEK